MITVRLPEDLEREVTRLASTENRTKTDIVRDALTRYLEHHQPQSSPYALGKDLFGTYGSGEKDRSRTYKRQVKERTHAKYAR